jgi:protein-tyrosine phosphatase
VLLIEEDDPPLRHQKFAAAVRANLDAGRRIGVFICREGLAALPGPVAELDLTAGGDDGEPHEQGAFPAGGLAAVIYADRPDAAAAANRLFAALRSLARLGADLIVAEGLPASEGLGAAYMNRLRKAAAAGQRKTVLFVCTGNTCRSPMAAALFNRLNTLADWSAESAGLAALPGEPASLMVQTVLLDGHGIDLSAHRARLAEADLVAGASHVLTMTENQRNSLRRIFPEHAAKIQSLGEMAGEPGTAVADPFGGSLEDYEETAAQLRRLIGKLLEKLAASSGEPEGQDGT